MGDAAIRNIIGFLVQVVPCAILCFLPFRDRIVGDARRVVATVACAILVATVPFTLFAVAPLPEPISSVRIAAQNLIFLALVAVIARYAMTRIDALTAQKVFVVLLVANFAYYVTISSAMTSDLIWAESRDSEYMYPTTSLITLAIFNLVFFVAMLPLMRYIRHLLDELNDASIWWKFSVLSGVMLVVGMVGQWIPAALFGYEGSYYWFAASVVLFALFLFWWVLRIAETISQEARAHTALERALRAHRMTRSTLASQLADARKHVEELTRALEQATSGGAEAAVTDAAAESVDEVDSSWRSEIVTVGGPRTAVSFYAGDLLYADSANRTRTIHLDHADELPIDVALTTLLHKLPEGHFALCHRSVLVNLHRVSSITPDDIVLDDGTQLPMSRRRYAEVREALARIGRA